MDIILTFLSMAICVFGLPLIAKLKQDGYKWSAVAMFAFMYMTEVCLIYIGCNI